ncbi:MAE_28990/MAE_18760 family HEPN-like nuclease [Spirulina subsalsa]|uniref:MAE_28990/MAE_18760 family HEPN-like nuclease n=1 Tax=Spirulina subsalsa TaxID=54311 RepID=UPI0004747C93|nr:MAE_28990/MAE_18760 family HEPN-like nuclease [Spirulina subsalsa]
MTSLLFQDFNERSREVSKYFMFLKNLEQKTTQLTMYGYQNKAKTRTIDLELLKTLKASDFLLLYNLVEATMRNAIETIFDELKIKQVSYDNIRPELKKIVLSNLKKRNPDKIFSSIKAISLDIINAGFDKQSLFSGNLDGKKVKSTAEEYGFSWRTNPQKTGNGTDLLIIKSNRNDLAHGFKSFAEIGKSKSADELLKIKNQTIRYLREILINIEQYLSNQDYLDSSRIESSE